MTKWLLLFMCIGAYFIGDNEDAGRVYFVGFAICQFIDGRIKNAGS